MYQQQQQQLQQVQQAHAMAAQAQSNPLVATYNPAAAIFANPEVGSFFKRFCWMWLSWSFPNFSLPVSV